MAAASSRTKNSTSGKGKTGAKTGTAGKSNGGARKSGRAWKLERASVTAKGESRPRSNKYAESDKDQKPKPGERTRAWVGGYTRADGKKVKGHYRELSQGAGGGSGSKGGSR